MQPSLSGELSRQRAQEARRGSELAERAGLFARAADHDPAGGGHGLDGYEVPVAIRFAGPADGPAIERLAALDSARPLAGEVLVAEVGGRIRAALSVGARRVVADPFERSADVARLLELRASQLNGGAASRRGGGARRALAHALPAAALLRRHA